MPYKDLERKKEWERLHRPQRLARRRELRRIEAEKQETRPEPQTYEHGGAGFLVPVIAGGALAAFDPKLGMAVGGIILGIAFIGKKGREWWIVGIVVLLVALFFHLNEGNAEELRLGTKN
jgi:cell division protein FtsW (lipid II flippase)